MSNIVGNFFLRVLQVLLTQLYGKPRPLSHFVTNSLELFYPIADLLLLPPKPRSWTGRIFESLESILL